MVRFTPVVAHLPPSAWLVLLLVCFTIAAAGSWVLRSLTSRHRATRPPVPLSLVALLAGPIVGLLFTSASYWLHYGVWEAVDLKRDFSTTMLLSTLAGSIASAVILVLIDLRPRDVQNGQEHQAGPTPHPNE